jgi:predicted GNAT family N-acyltransferase
MTLEDLLVGIEPLGNQHDRAAFSCGEPSLDDYLKKTAKQDQRRNVAQVFVATGPKPGNIMGYYTICATSIDLGRLPQEQAKRLPRYPLVPASLIGRLAAHVDHRGMGLGEALLVDALRRIAGAANEMGIYAVVVDALDHAVGFYARYGFLEFPKTPNRLFLPIKTIRDLFD